MHSLSAAELRRNAREYPYLAEQIQSELQRRPQELVDLNYPKAYEFEHQITCRAIIRDFATL